MSEWTWEYDGYDPAVERLRESLCTLGNGYFATRGAVPECRAGLVHYPATYAAGVYNRLESTTPTSSPSSGAVTVDARRKLSVPDLAPAGLRRPDRQHVGHSAD